MKLLKLRFELNSQCQAGYRKRRSLAGACVIVQREVFPACGNTATRRTSGQALRKRNRVKAFTVALSALQEEPTYLNELT